MELEDWRSLIDFWCGQGHALHHLDIPDNIIDTLGLRDEVAGEEKDMTEQTAQFEPVGAEWKRKRYFDGSQCGLKGCKREPDGYLCDQKPTKGQEGQLWFGPACKKCLAKRGLPAESLHTLSQLAYQRNGASDLALVLDIEVGEVLKRLAEAGIDERGNVLGTATVVTPEGETVVEPAGGEAESGPPRPLEAGATPVDGQPGLYRNPDGWITIGPGHPDYVPAAETGAVRAQQPQLPHMQTPPPPAPENGTSSALAVVQSPAISLPVADIAAQKQETDGVLAFLENFHITDQSTMDMAAGWLNGWLDPAGNKVLGVKAKWKQLDETRKAFGKPLREALQQIQDYFNPALDALAEAEGVLKKKIAEGNARAYQAQQAALQAAQQAFQDGNTAVVAQAAQQAATADVTLPQGVSQTMVTKFEIVDVNQLPPWAFSPDPNKIQMAINQGWTQIPGVRIWQEPNIRGSFK